MMNFSSTRRYVDNYYGTPSFLCGEANALPKAKDVILEIEIQGAIARSKQQNQEAVAGLCYTTEF